MNSEQLLADLKNKVQDLKLQKVSLEAEMRHLNEEKITILQKGTELGVDVKNLDAVIVELEQDVKSQLSQIQAQLNGSSSTL